MDAHARDLPYCDLVLKGGITSGVVYPLAIAELARKHRFQSIGGASAGAIAAAAAAAAEKGRASGGFDRLRAVSDDVALRLLSLFQPSERLRPVFEALLAAIDGKSAGDRAVGALGKLILGYATAIFPGVLPALLLGWIALRSDAPLGYALAAVPTLILGVAVALGVRLVLAVTRDLPENGFGLCSGAGANGEPRALTPWLERMLDDLAGKEDGPLTFGDLIGPDPKHPIIDLQIMTAALGQLRPYRIPFSVNIFVWRPDDFERLFSPRIVSWMREHSNPVTGLQDFRWLPRTEDLPVVVAVRMSLSFPILLSAVPLYLRDNTLLDDAERKIPRRCWFSDGGICSNFPIHFFDTPWPSHPTFGISLEKFNPDHHTERVFLPQKAVEGITRPLRPITSVGGFLSAMIDTMQEWRDVLQGTLPGYRERVASVRLDDEEGGLNLAMPPERVRKLSAYGKAAGELLRDDFPFDRHRWRRHLVWTAKLEDVLEQGLECYTRIASNGETFEQFVRRYGANPGEYAQTDEWRADADRDLAELMSLTRAWLARGKLSRGKIPRPAVDLRISPKI